MKKILISIVIMLVLARSCAPGSDLEVNTPNSTIELRSPGPNPQLDQPDDGGRVAQIARSARSDLWRADGAPAHRSD